MFLNKFILIGVLVISSQGNAYDGEIKNQYGRVIGYVKQGEITDIYGRTKLYIQSNKIKDKFGRLLYEVDMEQNRDAQESRFQTSNK